MTSASADRSDESEILEGTIISRYRIVGKIGAGQMGEVYRVRRTTADAGEVALKLIRPVLDGKTEPIRRFEREAKICAGLRHPNIVPVIDYGVWQHRPFLIMPVLSGSDLDSLITRVGALPPDVAVAIAIGCARGLACAHEQRIVHRDFKPANVFLDESPDGSVTPVVCDFGVAKALDPVRDAGDITATGAIVGTPLYMAPEQLLDSKRVDTRCDVWSLGMTLYHMIAGRAAFEHIRTYSELLLAMRDGKIPPLQTFAPWSSPQLARVIHAMLLSEKDRIPTIGEVIDALEFAERRRTNLTKGSLTHVSPTTKGHVATVALMPKSASELKNTEDSPGPPEHHHHDPEPHDPYLGRTLNNRYAVIARIGLGGMGAVYDATDLAPGRGTHSEVALKVMLGDHMRDTEAVKRFLREAKSAAKIANPYVAMVLDTGVDAVTGSPYLVMERLRGNDLSTVLQLEKALEPAPIVSLFLHACEALRAAHALGIVHRDIKPSNLFLHETADGDVMMKVCDFGIAKQLSIENGGVGTESAELTRTGGLLGSPLYMSPEQAKSAKNVDARSDVFSLALSLHETLSGQRPWIGHTSMGEIIVAVCTQDVPSLSTLAPWVDPGLVSAIERGLQRDVNDRFQSVSDFGAALRPYGLGGERMIKMREVVGVGDRRAFAISSPSSSPALTNQPVSITQSGNTNRVAKAAIAAGAVLLLALGGGGAFVLTQKNSSSLPKTDPAAAGLVPSSAPATPASSPFPLPMPTPSMVETSSTTTTPSVTASAVVAVPTKPAVVVPKPSQTPVAPIVSASASASPSPAKSGRGGTATDLP